VIALLDVNILVALMDEDHVHHQLAHDWFEDNKEAGWASCPLTENGLLRMFSNPAFIDPPVPLPELIGLLERFCERSVHHFWSDDVSLRDPSTFFMAAVRGYRQLTDVYLLGLAVKHRGKLVTFDGGAPLAAVVGAKREHLEVITPE
jgi:toxin-antitoxin system PIN domain toxin